MKNLKNKYLTAAIIAIAFLFGVFIISKATDKVSTKKSFAETTYYYNSSNTDLNSMKTASNWNTDQNEDFVCGGGNPIPCSITVTEGTNLQSHLQQFANLDQLLAAADSRRQEAP